MASDLHLSICIKQEQQDIWSTDYAHLPWAQACPPSQFSRPPHVAGPGLLPPHWDVAKDTATSTPYTHSHIIFKADPCGRWASPYTVMEAPQSVCQAQPLLCLKGAQAISQIFCLQILAVEPTALFIWRSHFLPWLQVTGLLT